MLIYEGFLLLGLILMVRLVQRRELAQALLLLAWSHASLVSVRHVPLFMNVSAPLVARELTLFISEGATSGNSWLTGDPQYGCRLWVQHSRPLL